MIVSLSSEKQDITIRFLYAELISKRCPSTELIIIVSAGRPSSVLWSVTDVQGKSSFQNVLVGSIPTRTCNVRTSRCASVCDRIHEFTWVQEVISSRYWSLWYRWSWHDVRVFEWSKRERNWMFIDVDFVTDRDAEDSVVQRWNEYGGHEIFLRNGQEKTRYASDCGSSKSTAPEEDDEKKKENDKDNDDGGLQVYYLDVSHVPVDFWTFQSDKISRKRTWMMYEDEERGERDVHSGLRSDRVELWREDETVEIWWGVLIGFLLIRFKIVLVHWRNKRIARLISTALISVIVYFASRETTDRDPVRSSEIRDQKNVLLRRDDRVIWYQTSIIYKSIRNEVRPCRHSISSVKRYRVRRDLRHFGDGENSSSYVKFSQCRQVWVVLSFATKEQNRTRQSARIISHSMHCLQLDDKLSSYFKEKNQSKFWQHMIATDTRSTCRYMREVTSLLQTFPNDKRSSRKQDEIRRDQYEKICISQNPVSEQTDLETPVSIHLSRSLTFSISTCAEIIVITYFIINDSIQLFQYMSDSIQINNFKSSALTLLFRMFIIGERCHVSRRRESHLYQRQDCTHVIIRIMSRVAKS